MEIDGVEIDLRFAHINGIRIRFAESGPRDGPLILFCHGWPESWYSWRYQLAACAKAGFHCVAPDMRGYGGTTAPKTVAEYNIASLAGDAIGLLTFLGYQKSFIVGHDWGADFVWKMAALFPTTFVAVCAMSVPYTAKVQPLVTILKKVYGDPFDKASDPKFFYMLHHNMPEAAPEYEEDIRESLFRIYCSSPNAESTPPEVQSESLYVDGRPRGMVYRTPRPKALPGWLSEDDLQYYVRQFEQAGFEGGLNWYRNMDVNASLTGHIDGEPGYIHQPSLFIAGADDAVIARFKGEAQVKAELGKVCTDLKKVVVYADCGHWIQQERAQDVNAELLAWLSDLDASAVMPRPAGRAAL